MTGPENPYAFPSPDDGRPSDGYGMPLRDYFAGQALTGFLADGSQRLVADALAQDDDFKLIQDAAAKASVVNEQIAIGCYGLADAMLAARVQS